MKNKSYLVPLTCDEAILKYGGFVKYFGTNEPVRDIIALLPKMPLKNILSCCGGGEQALTFLSCIEKQGMVFSFDINPAQLFVLAYKALEIKNTKVKLFTPVLDDLFRKHIGRLKPLPMHITKIDKLYDLKTKKEILVSDSFKAKFGFMLNSGTYPYKKEYVYWYNDRRFIARIRSRVDRLRLIKDDLLYVPDWFPKNYFDVIYTSDISLENALPFYLERLHLLISSLKSKGVIIGNRDNRSGVDEYPTVIEILLHFKSLFQLKVKNKSDTLIALEKI